MDYTPFCAFEELVSTTTIMNYYHAGAVIARNTFLQDKF